MIGKGSRSLYMTRLNTTMEKTKSRASYNIDAQIIEEQISEYIDREHNPLGSNRSVALSGRYELIRTNILHFLSITDAVKNREMAKEILVNATITSDLDLNVTYFRLLLFHLKVIDLEHVLEQASKGRPFLFTFTHTGPYLLPILAFAASKVRIALCIPPHLSAKFIETYENQFTTSEKKRIRFVAMDKPNFVRELHELTVNEHASVVTYMDGFIGEYTKSLLQKKQPRKDIKFLQARITPLVAISRLAHVLALDLVPVSAERLSGPKCVVRIGHPLNSRRPQLDVMRNLYGFLGGTLKERPTQWEGWSYFNNYLSEPYKEKIRSATALATNFDLAEKRDRYFLTSTNGHLEIMDRFALKSLRLPSTAGKSRTSSTRRTA